MVGGGEAHVVIRGIIGQMGAARVRVGEDTRAGAEVSRWLPFCVSLHQFEILTLDVPQVAQPVLQALERRPFLIRQNANAKNFTDTRRLLRLYGKRPDCRSPANKCDELAPSHVLLIWQWLEPKALQSC